MKAAEAADWQAYSSVTWWAVACAWTGVHSSTALRGAIPSVLCLHSHSRLTFALG